MVRNFQEKGIRIAVTGINEFKRDILLFIKSHQMNEAPKRDPRISFSILMKFVHIITFPLEVAHWLHPQLRTCCCRRTMCAFDTDMDDVSLKQGDVHYVCSVTSKFIKQIIESAADSEPCSFGMCLNLGCEGNCLLQTHRNITIDLGFIANPRVVVTYLLIKT